MFRFERANRFWLIFCPLDPDPGVPKCSVADPTDPDPGVQSVADPTDPDPGVQSVADPMDPDPRHCFNE